MLLINGTCDVVVVVVVVAVGVVVANVVEVTRLMSALHQQSLGAAGALCTRGIVWPKNLIRLAPLFPQPFGGFKVMILTEVVCTKGISNVFG